MRVSFVSFRHNFLFFRKGGGGGVLGVVESGEGC